MKADEWIHISIVIGSYLFLFFYNAGRFTSLENKVCSDMFEAFCGKPENRMVKRVKLFEHTFGCRSIHDITTILYGEDGNLDESKIGRRGESRTN